MSAVRLNMLDYYGNHVVTDSTTQMKATSVDAVTLVSHCPALPF